MNVIRQVVADDATALCRIYNHYVAETVNTFEEVPIAESGMRARILEANTTSLPWLVAERAGHVIGYAHASKWKGRCAYRFSVEVTVYLEAGSTGQGFGTDLYDALVARLQRQEMHVALAGIALPNAASVALHEKLGFRKVAHLPEVGFKFGRWIDIGYWQRIL